MRSNDRNFFLFSQLLTDLLLLAVSFFIALLLSNVSDLRLELQDIGFLLYLMCGWYFTARSKHVYQDRMQENQTRELINLVNPILWQILLSIVYIFAMKEHAFSRSFVIIYATLLFFLLPLGKIMLKSLLFFLYKTGYIRKKALVIGAGQVGQEFCRLLRENKYYGYQLVRYIQGELKSTNITQPGYARKVLMVNNTPMEDLLDIDEVFIEESPHSPHYTREIATVLSSHAVRLRIIPSAFQVTNSGMYNLSMVGGFPLLSFRNEPLEDVYNRFAKRSFDVLFSAAVLVFICSWLFPIIALAIKLNSKGPVFYRQERWGKRNRPFLCYKFRSMYLQAPETNEDGKFQQARKEDPRITKVGRFLRKTSLDEFPQFFNVLIGEMSVVGPRPHASLMNIESSYTIENYLVRHQAKPGITGWAQVNGLRGESSNTNLLKARIQHDIWYIENWTFVLDLKIIFLTFWQLIVGDEQAY